jgi:competence protein ComFC
MLRGAAEYVFALLFPDDCRLCGAPLKEISRIPVCRACLAAPEPLAAEYFCVACRTPFLNPYPLDAQGRCGLCRRGLNGFDAAYTFGAYDGPLRELIHLFKYNGIRTLAGPLAEMMLAALPREQRFDALVPMPLHWLKRWRRGFNQARLLAEALSRRTGIPVLEAARRLRSTASQAGLSHAERRRNVAGAFAVRRRARLEGLRLLLVDDVFTTGATASACAAALKRAGAAGVSVLALARTDRRLIHGPLPAARPQSLAIGASS